MIPSHALQAILKIHGISRETFAVESIFSTVMSERLGRSNCLKAALLEGFPRSFLKLSKQQFFLLLQSDDAIDLFLQTFISEYSQ